MFDPASDRVAPGLGVSVEIRERRRVRMAVVELGDDRVAQFSDPLGPSRHALGRPALSFSNITPTVKLADSWRGGNSTSDAAICITNACAGTRM